MSPEQLKALRNKLGLTQQALADRIGVNLSTVWRWEHGEVPILKSMATLLRLLEKSR